MKRLIIGMLVFIVVIFFCLSFGVAQTIDTAKLDLSKAKVSIAGPDEVYIRSIWYDGKELSVKLKYDGKNGAIIYGPYYNEQKILQDSYNLSYAKLQVIGNNELQVSDVILGNVGYSGILKWVGGPHLVVDSYWTSTPPKTNEEIIAELNGKISTLNKNLEEANNKINKIESVKLAYQEKVSQLNGEIQKLKTKMAATVPAKVTLPSHVVFSGFENGKILMGNWETSFGAVKQVDSSQLYAKYAIPVNQNQSETLFSFTAKAADLPRIGYGLHFFASGERTGRGYGFGNSFLLWLTRDKTYYKSNKTYLQLYRSSNDVSMTQVASIRIKEDINSMLNTQILYNRDKGRIMVYINGEKKLDYKVQSPLWSGDKIVLRTLHAPVEFTNLYVKTR